MIRIAICDDEQMVCNMFFSKVSIIMNKLKKAFEIKCYTSAVDLLQFSLDFDVILMDIQMPGLNGIEFAKKLRQKGSGCALIFISALKEYVFDAFEFEAVDYLCKPVDDVRLEKALIRSISRSETNQGGCLLIQTIDGCRSIKLNTIYFCEVVNRKIYLHTFQGVIEYYGKIGMVEKQLNQCFVRCHRSYLVNLDFLSEYSDGQIRLENGDHIPVSRLRHQEVMGAMLQYMKKRGLS